MYHAVGTPVPGDSLGLYNIAPERFESHMRILAARHRDSIEPLGTVSLKASRPGIILTFDDGYLDNLTRAYPVLSLLGIPFTVFVTTAPVIAKESGYLGVKELRELDALDGVTIGAHGATHVPLAECGDRRLKEELAGSKACLEDLLGHPVDSLSYPHGSVNRRVRDAAEQAGFRIGATSRFDINPPGRDPLLLCRTDIWAGDSDGVFVEKLAGDWDWRRWRHADPASADE
jgi:peptidoglycan/xylan/chitin deacetylase (PgdA/CDA1 family)